MKKNDAIAKLKAHQADFRQLGVDHLYLFGSTVRDEAREDSDVDLFFDHPEGSMGLFRVMEIGETACRVLGCKADVMTRRSLHRALSDRIEKSAELVF